MASNTKNVKLGVCKLYLDGRDLGLTQGGVEFAVSTETHRVEVDQFGKSAINELVMGRTCSVKAPLAETTIRNMMDTMPGTTLVSDGVTAKATVTFAADPAAGNSVTVGGTAFTFQAGKPTAVGQVKIGATRPESLQNLTDAINLGVLRQDLGGIRASYPGTGNIVNLEVIDPGTAGNAVTLAATGGTASGATFAGGVAETKARVEVGSGVGTDLLTIAKQLRLHPVGKADTDFSDDLLLYAAATAGALTFAYKLDAERIFNVEFTGYPHPVHGKLFAAGDLLA